MDLHGLLDFTNIPAELQGMVNNYKINLLDIKELANTDPAYKHMQEDAYDVIAAFTKSEERAQYIAKI